MKKWVVYLILGILLMLLGIAWNLAGMLNGVLSDWSLLGWVVFFIGVFYLVRSWRTKRRDRVANSR